MMDFNIRELADSFSKLLPHDNEKLKLSDIDSSGIPFLVRKRITQIVREKFSQSVRSPESEWADLHSSRANAIWNSYLQQMTDLLEIPSDKINDVLHDAVEFSLKLAVQPRKTIVKTLFENKNTVSKDDVDLLMDRFVVNHHLAFALSRYMEKKEKDTLGIDEARQVLKKVDQKLMESYNSLDWMDAVKPIFNVAGPHVPSGYIRVFFEEKEMPRVARKYDLMDTEISETDFVEVMSSADLLDLSGFEEEQPALFTKEDDSVSDNEWVETDETEKQNKDFEEPANSSMSDISANRDIEEDGIELDDETEWATLEQEQQEPYLLELFREDDESDSGEPEDEAEVEETPEVDWVEKFEDDSEFIDDDVDDDESEEISEDDVPDLSDFEKGKLEDEEDDFPKEENSLPETEMPREEELIEDEDEPIDDWKNEEEIEEGSLLDQFADIDDETNDVPEPGASQQDEKSDQPSSIYDELNLSPVEVEDIEDEAIAEEEDLDMDGDLEDDPDKTATDDDIPFEPNDRLEEAPDDQEDHDELLTEEDSDSEEEDSEDVPMWKSFLERDNPDDEPSFYFDEGSDEDSEEDTDEVISFYSDEEEINETPIINISDDANKIDDEIEHLSNWLAPDRERFLHSIFNDSKLAWEQALIDLTVFDDWKSASKYLENEIFNKNRIDIYSEVAVDFTDYLHSYFMEYKS